MSTALSILPLLFPLGCSIYEVLCSWIHVLGVSFQQLKANVSVVRQGEVIWILQVVAFKGPLGKCRLSQCVCIPCNFWGKPAFFTGTSKCSALRVGGATGERFGWCSCSYLVSRTAGWDLLAAAPSLPLCWRRKGVPCVTSLVVLQLRSWENRVSSSLRKYAIKMVRRT